jgi:SAM-dependent methyltransferase
MDRRRWRALARKFDRYVTDTPRNDARGEIRRALRAAAGGGRRRTLGDLGCGPATLIRRHAGWFRRAVGVDFAEPVLALARRRCRAHPHAEFLCADAADAGRALPRAADVLACMNVLTSASPRKREAIGQALAAVARPRATLLLVVPSWESAARGWAAALTRGLRAPEPSRAGVERRAGDPQKFWSAAEIEAALARWGFRLEALRKVRVPWSDEGLEARDFRGLAGPWDWLALARRYSCRRASTGSRLAARQAG